MSHVTVQMCLDGKLHGELQSTLMKYIPTRPGQPVMTTSSSQPTNATATATWPAGASVDGRQKEAMMKDLGLSEEEYGVIFGGESTRDEPPTEQRPAKKQRLEEGSSTANPPANVPKKAAKRKMSPPRLASQIGPLQPSDGFPPSATIVPTTGSSKYGELAVGDSIEYWQRLTEEGTIGEYWSLCCVALVLSDEALKQLAGKSMLVPFLRDAHRTLVAVHGGCGDTDISTTLTLPRHYCGRLFSLAAWLETRGVAAVHHQDQGGGERQASTSASQQVPIGKADDDSWLNLGLGSTGVVPGAAIASSPSAVGGRSNEPITITDSQVEAQYTLTSQLERLSGGRLSGMNAGEQSVLQQERYQQEKPVVLDRVGDEFNSGRSAPCNTRRIPPLVVVVQTLGKRQLPSSATVREQISQAILSIPSLRTFRPTGSYVETATYLASIGEYFHKGNHLKKREKFALNCKTKADGDPRRAYINLLAEIPTVSEKRAMAIVSVFPTLGSLVAAAHGKVNPLTLEGSASALARLESAADFGDKGRKLGAAVVATVVDALTMWFVPG